MNPLRQYYLTETRREFLKSAGAGIGAMALASVLKGEPRAHFKPRAKHVIYIHLVGAPSQLELFDAKPELVKRNGQKCPDHMFKGKQLAFIREHPVLLGTRFKFQKHGQSGLELSEQLPQLGGVADELCLVKSLTTDHFNHAPAQLFQHTGFERFGRPGIGSWVSYGLGSENRDLPGYVVFITGNVAGAGNSLWGSGFLPTLHQGIEFRSSGEPVLFLSNPKGVSGKDRREIVDGINFLNRQSLADVGDPEIATRIAQYELAFRMQTSVPELMDTSKESKATHALYGTQPGKASFANNCLLARRLVERGVRFVQLFDQGWDHHSGVFTNIPKKAKQIDQPVAALIKDLKQRGLLDETLIVLGGEFGRTPMLQGKSNAGAGNNVGRDHHKEGFTMMLAGGGVKGGFEFGATDELGYQPARDPVHLHDLNATILHLLGLNHEQLTYKYQGRDFRLTDVAGHVIDRILA
ncbi:MAG TPA: DUF1501 domain-containing protein [Verrucomicrobiales bacterium]|jgi:hypothetical protein|nr:DUF1501 domain-containing protein [Verrucomicrobiales bacterium]HIL25125.1 DUF1501 domain-containing protein [Verrucomicrobiota bacterium]